MSLLKSAFVTAHVALHALALALALGVMWTRPSLAFLGAALVSGASIASIFFPLAPRPDGTHPRVYVVIACIGMALAIVGSWSTARGALTAGVLGTLGFATFVIHRAMVSRVPMERPSILTVGSPLPPFELYEPDGRAVSSRELRGRRTVLVFHRGSFSLGSLRQVAAFASFARAFEARGAAIVVVCPDRPKEARALSKRLGLRCLVDEQGQAARALGLGASLRGPLGFLGFAAPHARPTVVVLDERGVIRAVEQPEEVGRVVEPRAVLDAL